MNEEWKGLLNKVTFTDSDPIPSISLPTVDRREKKKPKKSTKDNTENTTKKPRQPKPTKEELIKMYDSLQVVNYDRFIAGKGYRVDTVHGVDVPVGNDDIVILKYREGDSIEITAQLHPDPINELCRQLDPYEYEETEFMGNPSGMTTAKLPYWLAKSIVSDMGYSLKDYSTWGLYAIFRNGVKKALGRDLYETYCPTEKEKAQDKNAVPKNMTSPIPHKHYYKLNGKNSHSPFTRGTTLDIINKFCQNGGNKVYEGGRVG